MMLLLMGKVVTKGTFTSRDGKRHFIQLGIASDGSYHRVNMRANETDIKDGDMVIIRCELGNRGGLWYKNHKFIEEKELEDRKVS